MTHFKRSEDMEARYQEYRINTLKEWVCLEDLVKVEHLGSSICTDSEGLKYAGEEKIPYSLQPNMFPYDTGDEIKHYTLWATSPLDDDTVNKIVRDNFLDDKETIWYEQSPEMRSLKKLWHVHVFH